MALVFIFIEESQIVDCGRFLNIPAGQPLAGGFAVTYHRFPLEDFLG